MQLHTIWFVIIAIFWVGFFVLEGFDFGVGVLHTIVGKTETERRVALNTIGPWWDGNEVWLIVAGAGMFAAFPTWYATMFSALYLALLIVLAALMARGVAMEFKGKGDAQRWRRSWMWCTTLGSLLIPLLLGVGLGDLLHGLPINSSHDFTGNFFDLLTGYGLWTGVTLLSLCLLHGSTFLKLRTTDAVRERSRAAARPLGWAAIALVRRLGDLDAQRRRRPRRAPAVRGPGRDRRGLRRAAGGQRSRRLGVLRLGDRDRRDGRLDLHRPVSARDGLEHQRRLRPDRQQRRLGLLCAEGDDGRRRDLLPARAGLPGLVLPRLSRPRKGAAGAAGVTVAGRNAGRATGLTGCPAHQRIGW